MAVDGDWICNELSLVDLGDERLNARLVKTATRLAAKPTLTIKMACANKSEVKGAYRMFSNPMVDQEEIFGSHQVRTAERMKNHPLVFAIQDTTFIDFSGHGATQDLGSIGSFAEFEALGLILHSTLAINPSGKPLGLLTQQFEAREIKEKASRKAQKKRVKSKSIDHKESRKWLDAFEETQQYVTAKTKVVTLADREADIFELIETANQTKGSFLIRSSHNRESEEGAYIRDILAKLEPSGRYAVELPKTNKRSAKKAELEVRFTKITLKPSQRLAKARAAGHSYEPQEVYLVEAKEIGSYKDLVHWVLITNEPTNTLEEAIEKINWYKLRWSIEQFHRILKSGCTIEECRFQYADRLKRYISVMSIIAVRLFQLMMSSRSEPETPCTAEFSDTEWRVLYMRMKKTKNFPKEPPTLKQAVTWVAQLGGYQDRKSDPPPGMTVLWRGWQELQSCISMWEAIASPEMQRCGY